MNDRTGRNTLNYRKSFKYFKIPKPIFLLLNQSIIRLYLQVGYGALWGFFGPKIGQHLIAQEQSLKFF